MTQERGEEVREKRRGRKRKPDKVNLARRDEEDEPGQKMEEDNTRVRRRASQEEGR